MRLTNFTEDNRAKDSRPDAHGPAGSVPLWLRKLEQKMPDSLAVFEIWVLMHMTASVMKVKAPSLRGLSRKSCLQQYQRYTVSCLKNRSGEELSALRKAMYKKAFPVGKMLGNLPGLSNDAAKTHLIKLLYRNIGIRIMGSLPGEIRIPRCSFSHFYTPQMCAVMSGMDAGIICGLFGGGSLTFSERITQGCPACKAVYATRRSSS